MRRRTAKKARCKSGSLCGIPAQASVKIKQRAAEIFAVKSEIFPAGSGRLGRLMRSAFKSKISLKIFPKAIAKAKALAFAKRSCHEKSA